MSESWKEWLPNPTSQEVVQAEAVKFQLTPNTCITEIEEELSDREALAIAIFNVDCSEKYSTEITEGALDWAQSVIQERVKRLRPKFIAIREETNSCKKRPSNNLPDSLLEKIYISYCSPAVNNSIWCSQHGLTVQRMYNLALQWARRSGLPDPIARESKEPSEYPDEMTADPSGQNRALTVGDVRKVIKLREQGLSFEKIWREIGRKCGRSTVGKICAGKIYQKYL